MSEEISDNLNTAVSDKTPDILWHYTNIDSLINIVTEKQIRATHNAFLNDSMEVRSGFETILEVLRTSSSEDVHLDSKDIDKFIDIINHTVRSPFGFYIVSFSKKRDFVTQWQAYTPPEGGCAIGFKFAFLKEIISNPKCKPVSICQDYSWWNAMPRATLCKCLYPTQKKKVEIHKKVSTNINTIVSDDIDDTLLTKEYGKFFTEHVASIKCPCFKQEKEWRLIFRLSGDDKILYDDKQRPFILLDIGKTRSLSDIISNIIISPRGNRIATRKKLDFLINAMGEKGNINIFDSELPLR